jgi:endoribonuclease LACTB2
MSSIIDAVSIVLVFEGKLLSIQRQNFLRAFPGYWAFPGGKVDKGDERFFINSHLTKDIAPHLWGAIHREGSEELGIDLNQMLKSGLIHDIRSLGVAITPDFNPYRFATYFYTIHLKVLPEMVIDAGEVQKSGWYKPQELLAIYESGQMLAVPPVVKVMRALSKDILSNEIDELDTLYDPEISVPMIESIKGIKQFMPLSHTVPPASRTNCFLIGDLLIDPSPKDQDELKKLLHTLKDEFIRAIMLTHHHGDHHEHAPQIARELKLPMLMSQDTLGRIQKIRPDYFEGIEIQIIAEGNIVTNWLSENVEIVAVPGHDLGQLALMPENKSWFIAGDLFQGIGTVVIGGDEGDMAIYMQTLQKVIDLKPKVVFPSHGIGLGGTLVLERTLKHRQMREEQVLELYKNGRSIDEMLEILYSEIPQGIKKYARANILSHIKKLKEQNDL